MNTGLLRRFIESLQSGERSGDDLQALCLERIRSEDAAIRAWVHVQPQPALRSGPLSGIPFGAKDIFDTLDTPTRFGSPLYADRMAGSEAGLITELRKRGGVLIGKTHTTAFAYYDPAPTRNPLNLAHTPGGSSSGSAAAVAAGMVPFALGTQTQGSILRPASYCGVCGFKPTHGLLPTDGVLPFAPSLDTPGFFTQTADDMQLLWERLGHARGTTPQRMGSLVTPAPRLHDWVIDEIELPFDLGGILRAVQVVNAYEGARTHHERWLQFGDWIGPKLSHLVKQGLAIATDKYDAASETLAEGIRAVTAVYREYPVLLSHAATGPAPLGLESTGDPRMNAPWTGLRGPAITIPVPGSGLPVGLQLTAAIGNDDLLVETARQLELSLRAAAAQAP